MKRETRYMVFKIKHAEQMLTPVELDQLRYLHDRMNRAYFSKGKPFLQTVVVESDWPEYEPTWAAIERRVNANNPPDNKHYCNDGMWWDLVTQPDGWVTVRVGKECTLLEIETLPSKNAAYRVKNHWLTKYKMYCPE